jgi:outer membrane protein W
VPVEQTAATQDTYASYEPPAHSNKGRVSGFMGWAFSVPIGSVRDFTAVVSPLGFEIMIDSWITDNLSVGASGEWATYVDDRPRTTNTVDNVSITATAYNYMQTASARALLHYYYLESESVYPYVGPHIGVNWTTFDSETADLVLTDNRVSFSFGAETGVKIPFGRNAPMAIANLRYAANLQAEFTNKVTNVQSLALMLGLGF